MKRTIWICLSFIFVMAIVTSCKKTEDQPRDLYTYELTFDPQDLDAVLAQRFLNGLYNFLPNGYNRVSGDFLDAATDDAVSIANNAQISFYTNGIVNIGNNPDNYWNNSYNGIRQVNILLANIDTIPIPASNPNRTNGFKAEARFIRAFLYFELLKRYGGVPLIGDKVFTLNDNMQLPRNTYAECVDYIAKECTEITPFLYADGIENNNIGRVVKGAAVALKCRLYLYAASPLFNGGGVSTDPRVPKELNGYPTPDPTRWQRVISAVDEFRALGRYTLFGTGESGYRTVFTQSNNSNLEVIFAKQSALSSALETTNSPISYNGGSGNAAGRTNPTQDFVDAFNTINGKPITTDIVSSTNTTGYNAANPYANRDPRLTATVFFNGSTWLNRTVETFDGGRDRPNNPALVETRTGYYLRKFLGNFGTSTGFSNQSHNFIYFRYAEILLNYAEALNEVGSREEAVRQIILLRQRAGIRPGGDNRYGIVNDINQNDLRELIRNERRIELSFEEHRFWDVRRWLIANTVLNKTLSGIRITRNATTNTFSYQTVPVANITFQNKLYYLPIPYDESIRNSALVQNFGW